ncbi:hypothetical protein [Priestia endophytica]|uniref:hypothetical protein n=1 Tax=Priestia endophytica TaxID=135735 RepID=UPI000F5256A2|nr:hypothetical protein [Priestia endophytica]MED4072655.1 hypothetical protein [Priestia endophytica]RPK09531.1 hypothetical protein FH5_04394 [Priestia endophytica]
MSLYKTLFQLSLCMMVIFGGTFVLKYVKTGEVFVDQFSGFFIGLVLFFSLLFWKVYDKKRT